MAKKKPIIPDETAIRNVERDYPDASAAEKERLVQADTLMRLFKANSLEELEEMAGSSGFDTVIEQHNAKMKERIMATYEYIVLSLIRIQEPKGGQPLTVEEMILNCRRLHELEMTEAWHKSGMAEAWKEAHVDEAVWQQITSMPESEVDKLLWWLEDNRPKLKEAIASDLGVDPRDINLWD